MVVALTTTQLWVIRVLTCPCACNQRGASDYQGDSEGKNIDGVFTISLMLTGANMKQHCWFISSMSSFLPNLNKHMRCVAGDPGCMSPVN